MFPPSTRKATLFGEEDDYLSNFGSKSDVLGGSLLQTFLILLQFIDINKNIILAFLLTDFQNFFIIKRLKDKLMFLDLDIA